MIVRHLKIRNFRGIRELDWHVGSPFVCLVGPGNSTKSTVLEAIHCALSARWQLPISDSDFFGGDTTQVVEVEVTLSGVCEDLLFEDAFGQFQRGYDATAERLVDDPDDPYEPVLTVRFSVDDSLIPEWHVVKADGELRKSITSKERALLGVARIDPETAREFSWSSGSALSRLTESKTEARSAMATAQRQARKAIREADLSALDDAAKSLQGLAHEYDAHLGAAQPGLDALGTMRGISPICLFDGEVPLRLHGEGTRRLTALAAQMHAVPDGATVLVDEVEQALEPHRIRRLLSRLHGRAKPAASSDEPKDEEGPESPAGQVVVTTHSPTAVVALGGEFVQFVRSTAGVTTIEAVSQDRLDDVNPVIRAKPTAIFSQRIIVCEGNTEIALCRALDDWLVEKRKGSFSYHGTDCVNGGGNDQAAGIALEFRRLGYDVAFFGDSDVTLPQGRSLDVDGVRVVKWPEPNATEDQVFADVPSHRLQVLVDVVVSLGSDEAVIDEMVLTALDRQIGDHDRTVTGWLGAGVPESDLREALARASQTKRGKKSGWYKSLEAGEEMAAVVFDAACWDEIEGAPLRTTLEALARWAMSSE